MKNKDERGTDTSNEISWIDTGSNFKRDQLYNEEIKQLETTNTLVDNLVKYQTTCRQNSRR